jgi:hypothetical protein
MLFRRTNGNDRDGGRAGLLSRRVASALLFSFATACSPASTTSTSANVVNAPLPEEVESLHRAALVDRDREDVSHIGSSCADIARLEAEGKRAESQPERDVYAAAASRRRYEKTRDIQGVVAKAVQEALRVTKSIKDAPPTSPMVVSRDDLDALHARLRDSGELAQTLSCYDATAAKTARQQIASSSSALDEAVSCQASAECRAGRLVASICAAINARDRATADDLKKDYATVLHTPFDVTTCPKPPKIDDDSSVGSR